MSQKFTVVHCHKGHSDKSNKDFYRVLIASSNGNCSGVFVNQETFNECSKKLYGDITNNVQFVYDQETGLYKPFIKF